MKPFFTAFKTNDPRTAPAVLSARKKLVFALVAVSVVLTALELTARFIFWVRSVRTPPLRDAVINRFHPLRYEFLAGGTVPANGPIAHINQVGLRGAELRPLRGQTRILCIGDSCTFGYAPDVTDSQTYPALLAARLEQRYLDRFEVLNGGMSGFCSVDCLSFLAYKGLDLAPKCVVLMVGWNDPRLCHVQIGSERELAPSVLQSLAIIRLGSDVAAKLGQHSGFDLEATRRTLRHQGPPHIQLSDRAFQRYQRTLQQFVELCRAHQICIIFITLPNFARGSWTNVDSLSDAELELAAPHLVAGHLSASGWAQFISRTNAITREVATSMDVPLVDGSVIRDKALFADLCHLNAAGNKALAGYVADVISQLPVSKDVPFPGQPNVGPIPWNLRQTR
jgi:lysophospholipase L1-like esterase